MEVVGIEDIVETSESENILIETVSFIWALADIKFQPSRPGKAVKPNSIPAYVKGGTKLPLETSTLNKSGKKLSHLMLKPHTNGTSCRFLRLYSQETKNRFL
jgi:hypothetical protein